MEEPSEHDDLAEEIRHLNHAAPQPLDLKGLALEDIDPNPILQLQGWLREAIDRGLVHPLGMTLATASRDGKPSVRVVLLRGLDEAGMVFYTNYASRKGKELAENPMASAVMWWPELERQVRFEGIVDKLEPEESERYFHERPRESQIAAVASPQSTPIGKREELERRVRELAAEYEGREVPRPPFWGGYRLTPRVIEFWQQGPNRLHDRFEYRWSGQRWIIGRLAP